MSQQLRIAYFPDSFHEVNGVAHTSRNFEAYARRHGLPFLCVRAGSREQALMQEDSVTTLELKRSSLAIPMEKDLSFDPIFFRNRQTIRATLDAFRPDVIHITGPSELGIFGAIEAWRRKLPLAASWHTNVHEYAARRASTITRHLPKGQAIEHSIESAALNATSRFYRLAKVLFAPNDELCSLLERKTGRPCHLMRRGVDTEFFDPAKRTRSKDELIAVLGYVGRLSVEKNVALLPRIQRELEEEGLRDFRFLVVGHGGEEDALKQGLPRGEFPAVLRGEALAAAYANMDLFVFPSHTDTFGNVVLEALASSVPAIVTPDGGPRSIVRDGETGIVAKDDGFAAAIAVLLRDPVRLRAMRDAARAYALGCSWDAVFDRVYAAYATIAVPRARELESGNSNLVEQ